MAGGALSGITVVELGARIGAGVCGSLLAELGADTVFVETPAREGFRASKWRHRAQFAAGKLSFRPDPESPRDAALMKRLVTSADIVITSGDADGALVRGLAPDAGRAVVCDVTAHGATGPRAGVPDSEWQVQALSGIVATTGLPDDSPVPVPLPLVEYMTGLYAASAVVAALRVRRACGAGQRIDMALYDCAFAAMATFLPGLLTGGSGPVPRIGNRHAMISPWNVYRAEDGWILICAGSDAQWRRLCEMMGRPEAAAGRLARITDRVALRAEVDALVEGWTRPQTVTACAEALNGAAIANGAIVPVVPHPAEPNLAHRGVVRSLTDPRDGRALFVPGSALRMSETPGQAPERVPAPDADRALIAAMAQRIAPAPAAARQPKPPLAGIRVIEIGHYTTVPLSTRHMAALGAEVIKIEPPEGEATRGWLPAREGQGYFFTYMNSDKRSLALDLGSDEGAAALRELVSRADVLIENLKPGALARRGFAAGELARINPRLIYCAVSGFGHDSLYAGRPAYDSVIQAVSGVMDVVRAGEVPLKTGISIADLLGGEAALLAVLAALEHRDRTERGQVVDISMQDVTAWATGPAWNEGAAGIAALTLIRCPDGHVLAEAGAAELALTPDLAIEAAKGEFSADLPRQMMVTLLTGHGIAAAPVQGVHEMLADPQTAARGLVIETEADGVRWPLMASPLRLSLTPPCVRHPMPPLGRDNEAILGVPAHAAPGA